MGNTVSDLLYYDNPNRRHRANQLCSDTEFFCNQYTELKSKCETTLEEIKPKLAALLERNGYNTPEELDTKVEQVLTGDELQKYRETRERYNKYSEVESACFQISSMISVATGVFLVGLVAFGIITAATLWPALAIIGGVLAALGLGMVLFAAFEGDKERENLQKAINDFSYERIKACMCYREMEVLYKHVDSIQTWLDDPDLFSDELIDKMLNRGRYKEDFVEADRQHVIDYLVQWDNDRGAWTKEDPGWMYSGWDDTADVLESSNLQAQVAQVSDLSEPELLAASTSEVFAESTRGPEAPVERSAFETAFATINFAGLELAKQEIILPASLASVIANKLGPASPNVIRL